MKIREGKPTDVGTIVNFQQRMAQETEGLSLEAETLQKGVKKLFEEPFRGKYWLAEAEGKVVASLLTLSEWSDWRNGEVIWIHSVYVLPEYRKKGVFGQMYQHLKEWVTADPSLKGLRLYVEKNNLNAQKVYQRLGMDNQHYDMYEWLKP